MIGAVGRVATYTRLLFIASWDHWMRGTRNVERSFTGVCAGLCEMAGSLLNNLSLLDDDRRSDNFGGAASGWGNNLQNFQVWAELRDIVRYGDDDVEDTLMCCACFLQQRGCEAEVRRPAIRVVVCDRT